MTDQALTLDEVLAMPDPAASADTTTTTTTAPAEAEPSSVDGANRDEHGRFAPRATPAEPVVPVAQQPAVPAEPEGNGMVPQQALHEARKQIQEEREARIRLEARLDEMARGQKPATPAEQPKAPDFWENPDAFVGHALTPIQQAMQTQKLEFSRMMAETKFGDDVVAAADTALGEMAKTNRQEATRIAQQMAQAKHPYAVLVDWHKGVVAQQRIGNDPDAFVQGELEKMLADPAKKAELLARINGQQPGAAVTADTGTVNNVTRLPPSLSRIPGGANTVSGSDMSNEGLFAHATAGMKR